MSPCPNDGTTKIWGCCGRIEARGNEDRAANASTYCDDDNFRFGATKLDNAVLRACGVSPTEPDVRGNTGTGDDASDNLDRCLDDFFFDFLSERPMVVAQQLVRAPKTEWAAAATKKGDGLGPPSSKYTQNSLANSNHLYEQQKGCEKIVSK